MFEDIAVVGLDLAKRVFQVHAVSVEGSVVIRRKLRRGDLGFLLEDRIESLAT